jgi:hypothetical protein
MKATLLLLSPLPLLISAVTSWAVDDALPLRYEAEDAYNVHNISIVTAGTTTYADYHGTGSFIEWLIPIATPGVFEVTIRYSAGNSVRPVDLHVDNNQVIHYNMTRTQDWNTWETETQTIEISAGTQTFRLIAVDSSGPNVDYLAIKTKYTLLGYTNDQEYDGNQWYIAQKGIHTKFSDGDAPEILIDYEVYKKIELDQVHAQVYTFDCSAPAEGVTTATSFTTSDTSDPDLKILELQIDVDESKLYTGNIWHGSSQSNTEGDLTFCARIDLMPHASSENPPLSESFVETIVAQHVILSSTFEVIEAISAAEILDEIVTSDAEVRYLVSSCVCDDQFQCLDDPVEPLEVNSGLHLCVHSISNEVQVHRVGEFQLEQEDSTQGSGSFIFRAIENGVPNPLTHAKIVHGDDKQGDFASIETRLVTAFFEKAPKDVKASGEVLLAFKTDRRRRFLHPPEEKIVLADFETKIPLRSSEESSGARNKSGAGQLLSQLIWSMF